MKTECKSACTISREKYDAVLFDMDGVLTSTAEVHAASWKKMFDEYMEKLSLKQGKPFSPFDVSIDYLKYVDGKLRYEGVSSFLESRGIHLSYGKPDDTPGKETICGLGNLKNDLVKNSIRTKGVKTFKGSIDMVRRLRKNGFKTAVVTASRNCGEILEISKITNLFDVRIDGNVAGLLKLAGKPAPDTFIKAAEQLGVQPGRAVVVEDSISGIKAGREGSFGLVIGVDRHDDPESFYKNGADLVVGDLAELLEKI